MIDYDLSDPCVKDGPGYERYFFTTYKRKIAFGQACTDRMDGLWYEGRYGIRDHQAYIMSDLLIYYLYSDIVGKPNSPLEHLYHPFLASPK